MQNTGSDAGYRSATYDRQLLLSGSKRNAVLELWEVQRYGSDSYGDTDYVSIYGMQPSAWYAEGIRLLGRTAVECTRDQLGEAIGNDIAAIVGTSSAMTGAFVIDLFAGSANTLFWVLRNLPGARGVGFELDPMVYELTRRNLATLSVPIDIVNTDYASGLRDIAIPADQPLIAFIAPPWGDALSQASGLDLQHTTPPITQVLDDIVLRFPRSRLLCAVQVYESVNSASLTEVMRRFDWTTLHVYPLNEPGANHGSLLGTRGWVP